MLMYGEVVILLGKGGDIRHNSIGNKAEETVYYIFKGQMCVYTCIYIYTPVCVHRYMQLGKNSYSTL